MSIRKYHLPALAGLISLVILGYGGLCAGPSPTPSGSSIVPSAPANLIAAVISDSQIDLSWQDNSMSEAGFQVERSTNGITYSVVATVPANSISWSDNTVSELANYYYRVLAYNAFGYSEPSNEIALVAPWTITPLDTIGSVGQYPSLAIAPNNRVYIAYYDSSNADLKYASNLSGSWAIEAVDGAAAQAGKFCAIALDANNKPHISYYDEANADLKYATNAPISGMSPGSTNGEWSISTVDAEGMVGFYTAIAVDADNKVHIAYFDSSNSGLKYATNKGASGAGGASAWATSSIDSAGYTGLFPAIAVDINNKVHVSYYDQTNGNLRYANNAVDGSWTLATVDAAGDVGYYSDIAVDTLNKVHISYYDWTNGDLKYAANKTGSWQVASLDTVGDVGKYTSLALDSANNIHISYYDAGNRKLKYLRKPSGSATTQDVSVAQMGDYSALGLGPNQVHIAYFDIQSSDLKYATNTKGQWQVMYPPSELIALSISPSRIDITWKDNSGSEDGFKIERRGQDDPPDTGFTEIAAAIANGTYFSDTGLAPASYYYYRVRSYDAVGQTIYSNEATTRTRYEVPTTPGLASPANTATAVSTLPVLSWEPASNTTSYQLQLSGASGFAATILDQAGITATWHAITSSLSSFTVYYWRVKADNPDETGSWSSAYNFRTVLAAPLLAGPANNAELVPITPTLSWGASAGALTYQLQVARDAAFSDIIVDQAGLAVTSYGLSGLAKSTVYYWRVQAIRSDEVSAWSAVRQLTTIMEAPPVTTLGQPADNMLSVQVNAVLSWDPISSATFYNLQVATDTDFTSLLITRSNISATSLQLTGVSGLTVCYWRVQAGNLGGLSNWTISRTFTTMVAIPELLTPANPAADIASSTTLTWSAPTGAMEYNIQLATDSSFNNIAVAMSGLTATAYTTPLLAYNTDYYWRVQASRLGELTDWSSAFKFTIIIDRPTLLAPADGAADVSAQGANFSWSAVNGAANYRLQISSSIGFGALITDITSAQASWSIPPGVVLLENLSTYYWRACGASNSGGTAGAWSPVFMFTTIMATPPIMTPANNATWVSVSPNLTWGAVTGAATYQIEFATDPGFTLNYQQQTTTDTSYQLSGLDTSTVYYWRVRASNTQVTTSWTEVAQFTTQPPLPSQPTLVSPVDTAAGISLSPFLRWNAAEFAETYQIHVSRLPDFSTLVLNLTGIYNTSKAISGLQNNLIYYWRVRSINIYGTSSWSSIWSFATIVLMPEQPTLISPANGSAGLSLPVILQWNPATNSAFYRLRISTDNFFNTIILDQSGLTATSYSPTFSFSQSVTYYWQVRALSAGAEVSDWSITYSFRGIGTPVLNSPADNARISAANYLLTWEPAIDNSSYQFQFGKDPNFSANMIDLALGVTSYNVSGLAYFTSYYWRVKGLSAAGNSAWTASRTFSRVLFSNDGNNNWSYYRPITINAGTAVDNYQVLVNPFTDPGFIDNTGLVGSWHFSEGAGIATNDLSGYGNNGYLSSSNYITNPGFESGTWFGSETQSSTQRFTGSYAGQLTANGGSNINSNRSNQIPAWNFSGKTFSLSAWVNVAVTTGNFYLRIYYYDANNVYIAKNDWQIITSSNNGWKNYTRTITSTDSFHPDNVVGTVYIKVDFAWWNIAGTPNGTAYVDNYALYTDLPTWADGRFGKAISFDGQNDYVDCGNAPNFNIIGAISLEAWVKPNAYSPVWDNQIINKEWNAYILCYGPTGTANLTLYIDGAMRSVTGGPLALNEWTHVVGTYDTASRQLRIYTNGVLRNTVTLSSLNTYSIGTNNYPVRIGYYSSGKAVNGLIDEVKIYNRALAGAEIQARYNNGVPRVKSDYSDLRFTNYGNTAELPYWQESDSKIWVKIPSLTVGNNVINMVYGNVAAASTSNGQETFTFFDDFDDGVIDSGKWQDTTGFVEQSGFLWGGNTSYRVKSISTFTGNNILRAKHYTDIEATNGHQAGGWYDLTGLGYNVLLAPANQWYTRNNLTWNGPRPFTYMANPMVIEVTAIGAGSKARLYRESDSATDQFTDNNTGGLNTASIALGTRNDGLYPSQIYNARWDWVLVRKYAATEPAVSAPGSESPVNLLSNLVPTVVSGSQINITWQDNSTSEDGFKIDRSANGITWTQIGTTPANITLYSDSTITGGNTYYYRVKPYNLNGDGTSAVLTTTVTAPTAPGNLTATAVTSSSISLQWSDNSNNETGFKIERSTDGTTYQLRFTTNANATSWTETGLQPLTTYLYQVKAYNGINQSVYSNVISATTMLTNNGGGNWTYFRPMTITNIAWTTRQQSLDLGGSWDSYYVTTPAVLKDTDGGAPYKMWYAGYRDATTAVIGYATSTTTGGITWNKYISNPVVITGTGWDSVRVVGPTVLKDGGTYRMWYFAYDGTYNRIGYATSSDGISWAKSGANPVLNLGSGWEASGVANPCVIRDSDGMYKMWYQGLDAGSVWRIGYATSTDCITWVSRQQVLDKGASGTWDSAGVMAPSVIKETDGTYKMWYYASDGAATNRIGYAASPDGISWTKYPYNPVVGQAASGWDSLGTANPAVIKDTDGSYKMWYQGYDSSNWRIGYAATGALADYQVMITPFSDSSFINNSGLVGSWHFSEGAGQSTVDMSGSGNNGAITIGASGTQNTLSQAWLNGSPGRFGNALYFDGTDDYVSVADNAAFNWTSSGITIEAWINGAIPSTPKGIVSKSADGGTPYEFNFSVEADGRIRFWVSTDGSSTGSLVYSGSALIPNSWNHIVAVFNGTSLIVYLNGVAGTASARTGTIFNGTGNLNIARWPTSGWYWPGLIDEVKVYNRALSSTEIQTRYTQHLNKIRSDYADVRFLNPDNQELPYWQETDSRFWVKVPSLPATQSSLRLYYGNISATASSNGADTFDFFDDFQGATLDSRWTSTVVPAVVGSVMRLDTGAAGLVNPLSFNLNSGYILESRIINYNTEAVYGGTLSAISSRYTQANNTGADATVLYMRYTNSTDIWRWMGNGAATGFNIVNGSNTTASANNAWYILGQILHPTGAMLTANRTVVATQPIAWSKNIGYISLGDFPGGTGNIQDTGYDWVLARKFASVEPTHSAPDTESQRNVASNLLVNAVSAARIDITWQDNSPAENGFKIERAPASGGQAGTYAQIGAVGANVTAFSDITNVNSAGTYYYRLRAFDPANDYSYTSPVSTTTSAPAAPSGLITTTVTASSVSLQWADNSTNENGFKIESSIDGASGWAQIADISRNTTSYIDSGLQMQTTTYYRIAAYNGLGTVYCTDVISATTATPLVVATGGTVTYSGNTVQDSGGYRIHTFTSSGTFAVTGSGNVEVLVVAGGGGGGSDLGGGGGGGGLIYNSSYAVTAGSYNVTIGAGGAGGGTVRYSNTLGSNGGNSVFGSLTAIGGGRGGAYWNGNSTYDSGAPGGSAGGGGAKDSSDSTGGTGIVGQGNNGGGGGWSNNTYPGGGGGGAGAVGGTYSGTTAGSGGNGLQYSISGTPTYYAGGGGGSKYSTGTPGSGGLGGGGAGSNLAISAAVAGTPNTGGGGGGGGYISGPVAGAPGGSGIVIIRYPIAGGVVATTVNYTIHTFTSSGTFNVTSGGNVEVLVVAGGGGGGNDMGGGGGAGGVLYSSSYSVTTGAMPVTVGNGGAGSPGPYASTPVSGFNGQNSVFGSLTAIGGGGGGSGHRTDAPYVGGPSVIGGSGGGSAARYMYGGAGQTFGAAGTAGQGTAGGNSPTVNNDYYAGAGGGAGGNSQVNAVNATRAGHGGPGLQYSISGTSYYYGGGGGGAGHTGGPAGNGGLGGGGGGSTWSAPSTGGTGGSGGTANGGNGAVGTPIKGGDGGINTGGGGGGGSHQGNGGNGGSGIVIVRYSPEVNNTVNIPTNITAAVISATRIDLAWQDNSVNEAGFKIEASLDNSLWSEVGTVGNNITTFNHTGLSADTDYYYRIRSYYNRGNHPYSSVVTATTIAPLAPSNLITTTASSGLNIGLQWTDNSFGEQGFQLERSTDGGSSWPVTYTLSANTTVFTDVGVANFTTYLYRIRAYNGLGNSGYSTTPIGHTVAILINIAFLNTSEGQSGSIQTWTVTATGVYRIEASGAEGGWGANYRYYKGRGARMRGDFTLTAGTQLKILVGQQGWSRNYDGGGGGGTFVTLSDNTPLIVAGGGGGSAYSGPGADAVVGTSGTTGPNGGGAGGTGGAGGGGGGNAAGGGGLTGNGGNSSAGGGLSFINGGTGGSTGWACPGSFGGGGGTHGNGWGGGGGGGYSGGGGGASWNYGGGGGGSYNSGTNQSNAGGVNVGHGSVVIQNVSQVNAAFYATSTGQTGSIQNWTVPTTGVYQITTWGAEGGWGTEYQYAKGKGARMRGDFTLTAGTILKILVGQQGLMLSTDGGGGGGTFVVTGTSNAVIIAGGGGGSSYSTNGQGQDAVTGTSGTAGTSGGTGGTAGGGGTSGGYAGAGGGLTGNGGNGPSSGIGGGIAFINGGTGGSTNWACPGSFGGSGGTHGGGNGGGGGGGYSGGGASNSYYMGGGGGGSYNSGTNQYNSPGVKMGSGLVTIQSLF